MSKSKFQTDLKRGQDGEKMYLANFPELKRLDGLKADFSSKDGLTTYELKSDYYSHERTANFFIEILSDVERYKPGGPFQAMRNGTKYYEYLYVQEKILYTFVVEELVGYVLASRDLYATVDVQNEGWTTCGVLIPRADLEHLYIKTQLT